MMDVIGVSFEENSKIYYFFPNNLSLKKGEKVIVETERGSQIGDAVTEIMKINSEKINSILKKVIRIATLEDMNKAEKNKVDAILAKKKCEELIKDFKINMSIISATYTFDRSQLLFHFLSDERVDFRKLAKELANIYRTRIELRQVGVRDKAKEIGGIGVCGRCLCCSTFLKSFDSLSINMAKNQNMSLTPNKINGSCGRLLCCLGYENNLYEEFREGLPSIGEKIKTNNGQKRVISVDILSRSYKTLNENDEIETVYLDK
ncbi:MAG: stage 0 sporulation family protein [Bacilli bacterium]|nr:stage 0 sporulation family protein [Bacilli bacterium]